MGLRSLRCLGPMLGLAVVATVLPYASAAQTLAAANPPPQPADMTAAAASESAIGGDVARTRFVVGLEKSVEFQVFSLANPNRVIIELPDVKMQMPAAAREEGVGLVKAFYGGPLVGQVAARLPDLHFAGFRWGTPAHHPPPA